MTNNNNGGLQMKQPILPLTGTRAPPLDKHNSRVCDLSTQPGTHGASTHKMTVRALEGGEDLRCNLGWARCVQTVLTGLNMTTVTPRIALDKTLMSPTCFSGFNSAMYELGAMDELAQYRYENTEMPEARDTDQQNNNNVAVNSLEQLAVQQHTDDFVASYCVMLKETLPFKTLQKVKHHLRRNCRKPCGMKVCSCANHPEQLGLINPNYHSLPRSFPKHRTTPALRCSHF